MPTRRMPNSRVTVQRALSTALQTYQLTSPAERLFLDELFVQLNDANPDSIYRRFLKETHEVSLAEIDQSPAVAALNRASEELRQVCSHFHQVLDMAIDRGQFDPSVRGYYGRDINATTIPPLSSQDEIKEAGENITRGEAERQTREAGNYRAMINPSAADVADALLDFTDRLGAVVTTEKKTDDEREEAASVYSQARELVEDIWDEVEHHHRKDKDDASRRTKCARWGVVYIYDNGGAETPPPASPTTPPAGPAPTT